MLKNNSSTSQLKNNFEVDYDVVVTRQLESICYHMIYYFLIGIHVSSAQTTAIIHPVSKAKTPRGFAILDSTSHPIRKITAAIDILDEFLYQ